MALVLPVLSTIAAAGLGAAAHGGPVGTDVVRLASGFADAFRAAAVLAFAGALLAIVALRRSDSSGTPAHHPAH
jgi:hypothetical protein